MDDTKKMLKTIISGQSLLKSELLGEINKLRIETNKGFENVNNRIDKLDTKLTQRIDKLGKSLTYLEDSAPTRDEFDDLEKRVIKIEHKVASA